MATKEDVLDFVERYTRIQNEKKLLAEDQKELFKEFEGKMDKKALRAALRIAKIKSDLGDSEPEMEEILDVVDGMEL